MLKIDEQGAAGAGKAVEVLVDFVGEVVDFQVDAGFAAPAFADAPTGAKSVEVDVSGLDLNTAEGKAIAERRIDRAAKRACDIGGSIRQPVSEMQRVRDCITLAKTDALASLYPPKAHIADTGSSPEG